MCLNSITPIFRLFGIFYVLFGKFFCQFSAVISSILISSDSLEVSTTFSSLRAPNSVEISSLMMTWLDNSVKCTYFFIK